MRGTGVPYFGGPYTKYLGYYIAIFGSLFSEVPRGVGAADAPGAASCSRQHGFRVRVEGLRLRV